jgi:hypothetical protein
MLRTAEVAYAASIGLLVAYNIRWKRVLDLVRRRKVRKLPVIKVEGTNKHDSNKFPNVILLHGMWHTASWYGPLQQHLADRGYLLRHFPFARRTLASWWFANRTRGRLGRDVEVLC